MRSRKDPPGHPPNRLNVRKLASDSADVNGTLGLESLPRNPCILRQFGGVRMPPRNREEIEWIEADESSSCWWQSSW